MSRALTFLMALLVAVAAAPVRGADAVPSVSKAAGGKTNVVVIPVREAISEATHYLVRRALKDAIEAKADAVVLDMNTPGGSSAAMFDIIEALDKFPGETLTFIHDDAGSAGAIIAGTTREIWFAPKGVMGAAAAVQSGGEDIPETMRMKITSFFGGKVRTYSAVKGRYRADVLKAMMDAKFEFKIGDKVIKAKDELLSLTATEAVQTYGEPPEPLLATGIAEDLEALLKKKFGADGYVVTTVEPTWSESLAVWLNAISPLLISLAMLALFVEFKTPGFGVFGITAIVLFGVVFLGSYAAGLSGHEPLIAFALGVALIAAELFLFPGVVVAVLTGVVLVFGALVWAMADLWPGQPFSAAWSGDAFAGPLLNLGAGLLLAVVLALALMRYLPQGWFWDRMTVGATVGGAAQAAGGAPEEEGNLGALLGRRGIAATALMPSGQVEIDGRRYEAKVLVGAVSAGATVVVCGRTDFGLTVEEVT